MVILYFFFFLRDILLRMGKTAAISDYSTSDSLLLNHVGDCRSL